jgi:hypothetical protein
MNKLFMFNFSSIHYQIPNSDYIFEQKYSVLLPVNLKYFKISIFYSYLIFMFYIYFIEAFFFLNLSFSSQFKITSSHFLFYPFNVSNF